MKKNTSDIEKLALELSNIIGCLSDDEFELENNALRSPIPTSAQYPQPFIRYPDEYTSGEKISISCTQTELSSTQQKKLVNQWCEFLPSLTSVKGLYFHSRVPQPLFEAACKIPSLEALYIKWSGINNLEAIEIPAKITYLNIGSSPGIKSVEPISNLTNLTWLQLDNIKIAKSLNFVSSLNNLTGLGFTGEEFKNHTIESFEPLSNLTNLKWLHLGSIRTADSSLKYLATLKKLKWLGIANFFPLEEFAYLSTQLQNTNCYWLQPFVKNHSSWGKCLKCKNNWKVGISGKGSKRLCPTCDSLALARHVLKFNSARDKYLNEVNS